MRPGVTNHPDPTDTYSVPQNLGYSVNGIERKRTNGQLTLQFRPVDSVTATLDYTYSENKVLQQRNELSVWFNFGPSTSSWTDGPVAGPIIYSETIPPATSDLSMGGAKFATKNENNSLGFNLDWDVDRQLWALELDYPRFDRRVGFRQSLRLERGARCRGLLSRHHHGRLEQGLPGA